jgi:hypothetical protein
MGLHVLQEVVAVLDDLIADMAGMHDKNSRKGGMGLEKKWWCGKKFARFT